MLHKIFIIMLTAFTFAFTQNLNAATITKVKGSKVLINMEGESASEGDKFFAIDSNDKRKAIIILEKVKENKALGSISKGAAEAGMSLKPAGATTGKDKKSAQNEKKSNKTSKYSLGALLGYSMDTMSVKLATGEKVNTTGTGFSFKVLGDYNFGETFGVRGLLGYEAFGTKGNASAALCAGNTSCTTDISYIMADMLARLGISFSNLKPWIGGGLGFAMPASSSSNALDAKSIATTYVMYGAAGIDYLMSNSTNILFQFDYGMLPASDTVSASFMAFRFGASFNM